MAVTRIGKYEFVRVIGQGPLGRVFEGLNTESGEKVTVRGFFRPPNADDAHWQEAIWRYTEELKAASQLTHTHIARIIEFGEEDGKYYVASEFFTGQNLRQILAKEQHLPAGHAQHIIAQVLYALQYAHEHRAVHTDLTLYNVVIPEGDGPAKVINFGLGHIRPKGDSPYRAPEVVRGAEPDARSDLFSLGVIFYELLTGTCPFAGAGPGIVDQRICRYAPASPDVSAHLQGILAKMLAKNPLNRYQSAAEVLDDLDARRVPAGFEKAVTEPGETEETDFWAAQHAVAVPPVPRRSLADFDLSASDLRRPPKKTRMDVILGRQAVEHKVGIGLAVVGVIGAVVYLGVMRGGFASVGRALSAKKVESWATGSGAVSSAKAQTAMTTICRDLEIVHTESGYPGTLNLKTLEELGVEAKQAKLLLSAFEGDQLDSYKATGDDFEIRARVKGASSTLIIGTRYSVEVKAPKAKALDEGE